MEWPCEVQRNMLHKDEVKQSKNHFGSVKIGKFWFKILEAYTQMYWFVNDVYNDYFQMLQTFMSILWLYFMSPCQVLGFLAHLQFILFYFKFTSTKNSFKSYKIAWKPKTYIFTWNGLVRLKGICCTKMKWNNQKTLWFSWNWEVLVQNLRSVYIDVSICVGYIQWLFPNIANFLCQACGSILCVHDRFRVFEHICNLFYFILFQISFKPYKIACWTQKNIFYFME
jgi:hypothetical protein